MSAKCQQLGVSNHFRLIKKVKEKKRDTVIAWLTFKVSST